MYFSFVALLIISPIVYANIPNQICYSNIQSSCGTTTPFKFNIFNDVNEAYQLFWVDFSGKLVFYNNIAARKSIGMNSLISHHWILTSASGKIRQFTTSFAPFSYSGITVSISQIPFL